MGTAVALSLCSLFAANQTVSASEMLNIIRGSLKRGEEIVVKGNPLFECYSIAGIEFAGVATNLFCQQMVARGSAFYDP